MGDFVRRDKDGQLVYVERSADIIKHKAYRISASEVEAVLQDHPTVIGACVVGVPDEKVGERVKAIDVMKEEARGDGAHPYRSEESGGGLCGCMDKSAGSKASTGLVHPEAPAHISIDGRTLRQER